MDLRQISDDLYKKSYSEIPLAVSPEEIASLMRQFSAFVSLPAEIKEQFSLDIKLDNEDRGTELGYRRRTSEDGYDDKEFFHYNDYVKEAFPDLEFLKNADHIFHQAMSAMQEIMKALDTKYSGIYERYFPSGKRSLSVLRMLRYDSSRPGNFIAQGHYDRSSCTIAIAESAPGLRIGPHDQQLTEVTHRDNQGLFFPGLALGKYTNGDLAPSWHDVVQKESLAYGKNASRWALVFFCIAPESANITRVTTHTPLRR